MDRLNIKNRKLVIGRFLAVLPIPVLFIISVYSSSLVVSFLSLLAVFSAFAAGGTAGGLVKDSEK